MSRVDSKTPTTTRYTLPTIEYSPLTSRWPDVSSQHDVHEFFMYMLDHLASDFASGPMHELLENLFWGNKSTTVTCYECSSTSHTSESYQSLLFPVELLPHSYTTASTAAPANIQHLCAQEVRR